MMRRGFTLIELLIVVGLLMLLLTLLVPGLVQARRAALRDKCAGNLLVVGAALASYSAEHGGTMPCRTTAPNPYTWDDTLYDQLFERYLANPKTLYCPDNSHEMGPPGAAWSKSWSGREREISYAFLDGLPGPVSPYDPGALDADNSWNLSNRDFGDGNGIMPQSIRGAAVVYAMNAAKDQWISQGTQYVIWRPMWSGQTAKSVSPIMGDLVVERTNEAWIANHAERSNRAPLGMNALFSDGHVGWLLPSTPALSSDPAAQLSSRNTQYLWRRVYRANANEYLQWLWRSDDVLLPDRRIPP